MMTAETGTYRWMAPEVLNCLKVLGLYCSGNWCFVFTNDSFPIWRQLYCTVTLRHGEKKHYNHKVDAYSFAIVLWELIHNKLPFEGMSNVQAAYAAAFKVTIYFDLVL